MNDWVGSRERREIEVAADEVQSKNENVYVLRLKSLSMVLAREWGSRVDKSLRQTPKRLFIAMKSPGFMVAHFVIR